MDVAHERREDRESRHSELAIACRRGSEANRQRWKISGERSLRQRPFGPRSDPSIGMFTKTEVTKTSAERRKLHESLLGDFLAVASMTTLRRLKRLLSQVNERSWLSELAAFSPSAVRETNHLGGWCCLLKFWVDSNRPMR